MINIRYANEKDKLLLLGWVNNSDSIVGKLVNRGNISLNEHSDWFLERLKDVNTYMWIIENENNIPIGQIRFQKKSSNYLDVDIYVLKEERKKGIASKALNLASDSVNVFPLRAIVKKNNYRSFSFFSNNGFFLKLEDKLKWVLVKE